MLYEVITAIHDRNVPFLLPSVLPAFSPPDSADHYCKFTNLLFFCATTQTYETVITRICNILYLYVKNLTNTNNMVFLNQYEIAALIGATRVAVVKGLKQLRDDGRNNFV